MAQRDAHQLLRPRTASEGTSISPPSSRAPLLPHRVNRSSSPQAAVVPTPRCWRLWLLRTLLLGGALYSALLLSWSANRLGLLASSDASAESESLRSTMEQAFARETEALDEPLETNPDQEPTDQHQWSQAALVEEDLVQASGMSSSGASAASTEALDEDSALPTALPSPERHIKFLRESREKARIERNLPHMHHTLPPERTEDQAEAVREAEEHALSVRLLPRNESSPRRFRCVGWRATGDCSPDGPREPERDHPCSRSIKGGEAGYCELEDRDSGERFRVLLRHCDSMKPSVVSRCSEAGDFVTFPQQARSAVAPALEPGFALPNVEETTATQRDGILMVVYPKLLASAYATVHTLRDVLGCQLPIELWFRPREMLQAPGARETLQALAESDSLGSTTLHEIDDPWATGFAVKSFALYHSFLERVLFLDADNVPTRDPSYLFESREFQDTGAIFWPDFWHPEHTIFNIKPHSLVWELLDMPFVDMFEQESGQILIDRRRHAAPLELLSFYTFHRPNHFSRMNLAYGDKDLFRFAWLKLNASFHMIQAPPAVAGTTRMGWFCGMTMVQHDPQGEVLFLHRNSHKLTGEPKRAITNPRSNALVRAKEKLLRENPSGRKNPTTSEVEAALEQETPAPTLWAPNADGYPDAAIWTHLLSFHNTSARSQYVIQGYHVAPHFPRSQSCYGVPVLGSDPNFYAQEIADLSFAGLETELRRFALEATQLHREKLDALTQESRP